MCLAPRREQVMGQMIFVVLPAVVLAKENLDAMPRALDCVGVITGNRIAEFDAVIDGVVLVTLRAEIMIRSPAITNDLCAGFDPVTYYCQKCVGGSVLDGNKKCLSGLSIYTARHPLTLNRVSPMIFSPTDLLSSISTVLLGPPFLTQLRSKYTSMTSLQNMPQSASVCGPKRYSLWIWCACLRQTMQYVRINVSRRVRLLCWNQDPSETSTPRVTSPNEFVRASG